MNDVWEAWKTLFFQAVERNIQKKEVKRRRDVPWLNSDLPKNSYARGEDSGRKQNSLGIKQNEPTIKNLATW